MRPVPAAMDRLLGLETEYGLYIEGVPVGALTQEARRLVHGYTATRPARWDYRDESPLQDQRGFRAPGLTRNPKDDELERASPARAPQPRTPHEEHVDKLLFNGARFYHDHGHPEYSTPECRSLWDLLAHDRAGERIVWEAAQLYRNRTGRAVALYKNNSDYHGMSYGCHENYLVRRDVPFERLARGLIPFLVTRILFAGAGKVGAEAHLPAPAPASGSGAGRVAYQLSQRADFFDELLSVDTLHRRPLINTRDEPHADPTRWRRLHVICGDALMSEYANALKVGTTALVLDVLERGAGPPLELKDPLGAIRAISRNPRGGWLVESREGRTIPAVDVQRAYLAVAQKALEGRDPETDWVLRAWEETLDALERDPLELADRLDWAAKLALFEEFLRAEGLDWATADLEWLQSLELEYHSLDPERGLYWALRKQEAVRRLVRERDVKRAQSHPPRNTRAYVRGLCLRRFDVEAASWRRLSVRVRDRDPLRELDLGLLVDPDVNFEELPADAPWTAVREWVELQTRAQAQARARR